MPPHATQPLTSALIVTAILALVLHEVLLQPHPHEVLVRFFDVGQGDSIFITGPAGEQILIDGGPDLQTLEELGKAMPFFDRSIDWLILTHPHLDHIASFPDILRRYRVKQVMISGAIYDNGPYEEFLSILHEKNIRITIPKPGDRIDFGDGMTLDILWPPPIYFGQSIKEIHESCVVTKLQYGDDSVLLTGDMETAAEDILLKAHADVSATVLKVAHHGSKTSSSSGFLLAVHPERAIISVANVNTYSLPSPAIVERLRHFGIPFQTTMSGTILWKMDGKTGF